MSTASLTGSGGRLLSSRRGPAALLGLAVLLAWALGRSVGNPLHLRLSLVVAFMVLALGLRFVDPDKLLVGLVIWLVSLGVVRRLLTQMGPSGPIDPLLLVAPFALAILVFHAAQHRAFDNPTRLSKAVGYLTLLLVLEALNPLQPSIVAGLVSLLFLLVPVGAFWIGRVMADRTLGTFLKLTVVSAVVTALYGLMQTLRGFPSWDVLWIRNNGYTALSVMGQTRPFATFSSASEYGVFLAAALVICLVLWSRPATLPLALGTVVFLAVALAFQSSRGAAMLALVALALIAAAWLRVPSALSLLFVALAMIGLVAGLRQLAPPTSRNAAASALLQHELSGLANPLNPDSSTLGLHYQQLTAGAGEAFRQPFGHGIAGITIAGAKFGGGSQGLESDAANVGVALGLPGLIAYAMVLVVGMRRAYNLAAVRRDALSLACLGILAVTLLQWLNGGQYAVAFLPWIALGWIDARSPDPVKSKAVVAHTGLEAAEPS
ncbi:MAG: hypothetical protein NVSMB32_00950 [Actinomycetota bacterium]